MDSSTALDNYANPTANLAIAIVLPILGTFAVITRFSLQIAKKVELRADDWLCLIALVSFPGGSSSNNANSILRYSSGHAVV